MTQVPPVDYAPPDAAHDPYASFRYRDYRLFAAGNVMGTLGWQMTSVAVGYEIFERTQSATALGIVGFVQVIPVLLLSLPAGHLVDRYDRRRVILLSQLLLAIGGLLLGLASYCHDLIPPLAPLRLINVWCATLAHSLSEANYRFDDPSIPVLLALLLLNGAARSANQPAKSAYLPQLIPRSAFGNAVAWNSSLFEICSVAGPALAGGLIALLIDGTPTMRAWALPAVYLTNAGFQLGQFLLSFAVHPHTPPRPREPATVKSLLAGLVYVWKTKILLATLSLDLLAVILGGATALLPIFALKILDSGPIGYGMLRAAPSIGAFSMALLQAHLPPTKQAGRNMLLAVAAFGLATIVFGLSENIWLSGIALALTGAFDNVSVVVRQTLVQTLTPDAMRGRVSAVNAIFIGSSNQLGALESGLTAAMLGAVGSVVLGGIGTVVVVVAAALIWPELASYGELQKEAKEAAAKGPEAAGTLTTSS